MYCCGRRDLVRAVNFARLAGDVLRDRVDSRDGPRLLKTPKGHVTAVACAVVTIAGVHVGMTTYASTDAPTLVCERRTTFGRQVECRALTELLEEASTWSVITNVRIQSLLPKSRWLNLRPGNSNQTSAYVVHLDATRSQLITGFVRAFDCSVRLAPRTHEHEKAAKCRMPLLDR